MLIVRCACVRVMCVDLPIIQPTTQTLDKPCTETVHLQVLAPALRFSPQRQAPLPPVPRRVAQARPVHFNARNGWWSWATYRSADPSPLRLLEDSLPLRHAPPHDSTGQRQPTYLIVQLAFNLFRCCLESQFKHAVVRFCVQRFLFLRLVSNSRYNTECSGGGVVSPDSLKTRTTHTIRMIIHFQTHRYLLVILSCCLTPT